MANPKFHNRSNAKALSEIATLCGAEIKGDDPDLMIEDVSSLKEANAKTISFLDNVKYKDEFKATQAGACIVSAAMVDHAPQNCQLLISKNPYKAYALVAQSFYPVEMPPANISDRADIHAGTKIGDGCVIESGAVIAEGVVIGAGSWVEPNAVIAKNVEIGARCRIGANASISHAVIGDGTRLYPGVRIGQDGFGFAIDPAGHVKVPQLGIVRIGDHVEIGANSCVDRGAGPDTIIGDGTWIDNFVQIGHNVKIGKGCVIVAQAGVAGSSTLEDYAVLAAQVGVAGHLTVGMGAQIAGQTGVMQDVPAGAKMMGYPAMPIKQFMRQVATLKKLTSKG